MSSCVHMYVAGAVPPKCVVPDATDQRSLKRFTRWTSEGFVMMHIVLTVTVALMSSIGWTVRDVLNVE